MQEFVVVAKKIWLRMNELIFNTKFKHPNRVVREAQQTLQQILEMKKQHVISTNPMCSTANKWKPPPLNTYKLNLDAAVDKAHSIIGIGVIAQDYEGKVIATLRTKRSMFLDPLLVESYGILQATIFGLQLGLRKVLKNEKNVWTSVGMFVMEAKDNLRNFARWEVQHVRRKSNVTVHVLAKDSLDISNVIVTMEENPLCISSLL
ncbi:hypothetical protein I3843_05G164600 [Carya illinoinensis]|nr:hypothetical protein I3843_05G164600 [Carya illinoinensis]